MTESFMAWVRLLLSYLPIMLAILLFVDWSFGYLGFIFFQAGFLLLSALLAWCALVFGKEATHL